MLTSAFYGTFEAVCQCKVRVIFSSGPGDIEAKLRWGGRSADLLLVSEHEAESLAQQRLVKAFGRPPPSLVWQPGGLLQKDQVMPEGIFFIPLFADAIGFLAEENQLSQRLRPGVRFTLHWSELGDLGVFAPLRGRLLLPTDLRFQELLARKAFSGGAAAGDALSIRSFLKLKEQREAWLQKLRSHGVGFQDPWESAFLGGDLGGVVTWYSRARAFQKMRPAVQFAIPPEGTWFERFGLVIVAESGLEDAVSKLAHHLWEQREALAKANGFVPLGADSFLESPVSGWQLLTEKLMSDAGKLP